MIPDPVEVRVDWLAGKASAAQCCREINVRRSDLVRKRGEAMADKVQQETDYKIAM